MKTMQLIEKKVNFILKNLLYLFPIFIISGPFALNLFSVIFSLYAIFNFRKFYSLNKNIIIFFFSFIFLLFPYESIEFKNSLFKYLSFFRFVLMFFGIQFFLENNFNQKNIVRIYKVFLIILGLIILDIFIEYFAGSNILGFSSDYVGRIASFTRDELIIGYILSFLILFTLSYICNKINYFIFLILLSIFVVTSFLIGERSNFLKLFFLLILFTLTFTVYSRKLSIKNLVVVVTSIFLIIYSSTHFIKDSYRGQKLFYLFSDLISSNDGKLKLNIKEKFTNTSHYPLYVTSYKIFRENPLFGIGINNFFNESHKKKYEIKNKENLHYSTHPHQIYLEILSEVGLVGAIYFLFIFFYPIYIFFKSMFPKKQIMILSHMLLHLFFIFPILPTGSIFGTNYGIPFWFNLSILIFLIENKHLEIKK